MFCKSKLLFLSLLISMISTASASAENISKASESDADSTSKKDDFTTSVLHEQVLLDRLLLSPGAIDGIAGRNADAALEAFQQKNNLKPTGKLDDETSRALVAAAQPPNLPPVCDYKITDADADTSFTVELPHDMAKLAKYDALAYQNIQEMLGERFHCTPELLKRLNPDTTWEAGQQIIVPNVLPSEIAAPAEPTSKKGESKKTESETKIGSEAEPGDDIAEQVQGPVSIIVSKDDTVMSVLDKDGNLAFHAPVTAGSEHDALPLGEWKVNGVEKYPTFHYNPELFWDAEDADKQAKIPAGPNNPVGAAWIDISKPHYGLHGTPEPSKIGYTESHGCVRLTNWDVLRLAKMVKPGAKVYFVETHEERRAKADEIQKASREKEQHESSKDKSES